MPERSRLVDAWAGPRCYGMSASVLDCARQWMRAHLMPFSRRAKPESAESEVAYSASDICALNRLIGSMKQSALGPPLCRWC
jgi:hypothetical protein